MFGSVLGPDGGGGGGGPPIFRPPGGAIGGGGGGGAPTDNGGGGGGGGGGAPDNGGGGGGGGGAVPADVDVAVDDVMDVLAPVISLLRSASSSLIFSSRYDCRRFESSSFDENVFRNVEYSFSTCLERRGCKARRNVFHL